MLKNVLFVSTMFCSMLAWGQDTFHCLSGPLDGQPMIICLRQRAHEDLTTRPVYCAENDTWSNVTSPDNYNWYADFVQHPNALGKANNFCNKTVLQTQFATGTCHSPGAPDSCIPLPDQASGDDYEEFTAAPNTYQNIDATMTFVGNGSNFSFEVDGYDFLGSGSYFDFTADPIIKDSSGNIISTTGICRFGTPPNGWCNFYNRTNGQRIKTAAHAIPTINGEIYTIRVQGQISDTVTPAQVHAFSFIAH